MPDRNVVRVYSKRYANGSDHAMNVLIDHDGTVTLAVDVLDMLLREAGWRLGLPEPADEDDESLPPPMFDVAGDTPTTDGPRSSGWYGGTE